MSFLTELDVINDMLSLLGEAPVNSLEEGHALIPAGRRELRQANAVEQAKSWWFNKEFATLYPDMDGYIMLPTDTIRVSAEEPSLHYAARGRKLYQPYAAGNVDKFKFTKPVTCWLVRLVPFEDLPIMAQSLVSLAAQIKFQLAYDGDAAKTQSLKEAYRNAYVTLNAEHIRSVGVNLLERPSTASRLMAIGPNALRQRPIN